MALYVDVSSLNLIHWAISRKWRDWQSGVADTEQLVS